MLVPPVSLAQVLRGRDGRQYEVSGQAGLVAQKLHELDDSLKVYFNEDGDFFVVVQVVPDGPKAGQEEIVGRVPMADWNERVVEDFAQRAYELRNGINPCDRLEAMEDAKKVADDAALDEMIRERAAPLFRAFQREVVGMNPRIFVARSRGRAPKAAAA